MAEFNIKEVFSPAGAFPTYGSLVTVLVKNAVILAGVISFLLLVFGGFSIITGSGDTKKLEQGKQAIVGAVVGLILVVTSVWIVQIIERVSGVILLGN